MSYERVISRVFTEEIFDRVIGDAVEAEIANLDIKLRYKVDDVIEVMDSIHNRVMAALFQPQSEYESGKLEHQEDADDDYDSTESCDNRRRSQPVWFVTRCLDEYKL